MGKFTDLKEFGRAMKHNEMREKNRPFKIKDIRNYRTFYKEKIRQATNRDEHFMGTCYYNDDGSKKFGWFEIYHGDKEGVGESSEGIRNYLQSFLDMAKDGQAVYEFLQNAVDAGSSHFTMLWGKDEVDSNQYVLVANNGEMFSFENVRSILNVGSTTKTSDSKNIGKFGIGFKLAHRLVGKDNGLDELLSNKPSGPILFSWKNHDIANIGLKKTPEPEKIKFIPMGSDKYDIGGETPWLFKILVTCFPALPHDGKIDVGIRLSDGNISENPVFETSEYNALCRWVKKHKNIFDKSKYKEGSLFFIKLGKGKENDLADINLEEGVRFSLAILQETNDEKKNNVLETVQINDKPAIKKPKLQYLTFKFDKENNFDDYIYIRFGLNSRDDLREEHIKKLSKEDDIEVLFGFKKHNNIGNYFIGAPNLYLYFPLSEEVHKFNFVLHSNAFYKASSRTFLHKGTISEDGINERLLRTISKRLVKEFEKLYTSENPDDREKFLDLYASLLTSKESDNHDRQWIKKPFIDELTNTLQKCVPLKVDNTDDYIVDTINETIYFKYTNVDIPFDTLQNEYNWFYWGKDSDYRIKLEAISKLGIATFDIFSLMQIENIFKQINSWILEDKSRVEILLKELIINLNKENITENFKLNLSSIKFFEFTDGSIFSINELIDRQDEGYIILHNNLSIVKNELRKMGIKYSKIDLDEFDPFYHNYNSIFKSESQLRSQPKLIEIFNRFANNETLMHLSKNEKLNIFQVFRNMTNKDYRTVRLPEIKLFKNNGGDVCRLKNILKTTKHNWLELYTISIDEEDKRLNPYLLSDESKIYTNIIYNHWGQLSQLICSEPTKANHIILDSILEFYHGASDITVEKSQIIETGYMFFNGGSEYVQNPYFNERLISISDKEYTQIQKTVDSELNIQLPDYDYIHYYKEEPFCIPKTSDVFPDKKLELNFYLISQILKFYDVCKLCLEDVPLVIKRDSGYQLDTLSEKVNYFSNQKLIIKYVHDYYPEEFVEFPPELDNYVGLIKLKSEELNNYLIERVDTNHRAQLAELTRSLLTENKATLVKLLEKHDVIKLDTNWEYGINETYINLFQQLLSYGDIDNLYLIQDKIVVNTTENEIKLNDFDELNDSIVIRIGDDKFPLSRTEVLGINDYDLKHLIEFKEIIISKNLMSVDGVNKIFKVKNSGVSDELIDRFNDVLNEHSIMNADQLAFIILMNNINPIDLSNYKVLAEDGKWYELEGNWILPKEKDIDYFNKSYQLSNCYLCLGAKLKLKDNSVYFYGNQKNEDQTDYYILPEFQFVNGVSPSVLGSDSDLLEICNYLNRMWSITPIERRVMIISDDWNDVLGFNPSEKIYNDLIINSEKLSSEIITWLNKDTEKRLLFLRSIGVFSKDEDIIKLREWFLKKELNQPFKHQIDSIKHILLSNTLVGLGDIWDKPITFEINSEKHNIVNQIINLLLMNVEEYNEIRLPVYNDTSNLRMGDESTEWPKYLSSEIQNIILEQVEETKLIELFNHVQIIYYNTDYNEFALDIYDEFELLVELDKTDEIEHDENFYQTWSEDENIKLIKLKSMVYDISYIDGSEVINLGRIEKGNFEIENDEGLTVIYYNENYQWESIRNDLIKENQDLAKSLSKVTDIRSRLFSNFIHTLSTSSENSDDAEIINALLKKHTIEKDRQKIIEEINEEKRYSYNWFLMIIEYLHSFENIEDTIKQRSISFQSIDHHEIHGKKSEKYFILESANSLIPANIESFEEFNISLVFSNKEKENIKVEGVSKKGQNLLIYIPNKLDVRIQKKLSTIVNIKINFSPVLDLIQQLLDAFRDDEIISDWEDITDSLPKLKFLYGPPGTGKTTKLCNLLKSMYSNNPVFKSLVIVPTNKGGDVIAKKIVQENDSSISLTRIGNPTDPELEAIDEEIYQPLLDENRLDSSNVLVSTIHRLPYFKIYTDKVIENFTLFSDHIKWDIVIFDESSMISLPYFVFAIMALKKHNPNIEIIISGDPKQIPPIVDCDDKELEQLEYDDESIYKMMEINSFDPIEQELVKRDCDSIENLSTQYRSVETIGNLFSQFSYGGLLKHGRELEKYPQKKLPATFISELAKSISIIDFPIDSENSVLMPQKLLFSSYHVYAGLITSELLKYLDSCNDENRKYTIGIISPYKAQAMLINKLITSSDFNNNFDIYSDTVHGFQGDECDIVIFVINPNQTYFTGHSKALLSKEYIYNVAISRAKDYLWILNPIYNNSNNPFVTQIEGIGGYNRIHSSFIEKTIFNDSHFIEKHSYLTGHDSINVFGQTEMKYFIKAGNTAIDIQLKN
jgi:hypothetical protein